MVHAGEMLVVKPDAAHLPDPVDIDESLVLRTATLITEFSPLPSLDLMRSVAADRKDRVGHSLIRSSTQPAWARAM